MSQGEGVGPGSIARPDPRTPGSLPAERLISVEQESPGECGIPAL